MAELLPARGAVVPLRTWIEDEVRRRTNEQQSSAGADDIVLRKKQSLVRRATVAYGAVELLVHLKRQRSEAGATAAPPPLSGEFALDNFVVHLDPATPRPWNDVQGVGTASPGLSVQLSEPSFLSGLSDDGDPDRMGRYLEADVFDAAGRLLPEVEARDANPPAPDANAESECRSLGVFMYQLCSGTSPFPGEIPSGPRRGSSFGSLGDQSAASSTTSHSEPARKVRYDKKKGKAYSTVKTKPYASLQELGYPSSICLLVQHLLDGHAAYSSDSLEAVRSDLHLLLTDPDCYLFDLEDSEPIAKGGSMQLRIQKGRLFGRDEETKRITDAYCQVSAGKNAAFFIGGYSGSGKTTLVKNLTARVDVNGGYVLTQKVDQMSREKPLLGVLAAFNKLCLLIKKKCSSHELLELAGKFARDFESDCSVLLQLLPNSSVLFPDELVKPVKDDKAAKQTMNLHNICFILQRFLRIVSSKLRPVMLFLDDIQWAAPPMLQLIQALLSDDPEESSFFFVGCYRDNEAEDGHPLFSLISNLESRDVELMRLTLRGLAPEDLNAMVSEMLAVFPRLCRPLSDIVSEKTKGNPFFAIEFLKSLVSSSLLRYSLRERRWIWDEDKIRKESITDNVLYLLTTKMTSLPQQHQTALRVASCFGIRFSSKLVDYLCSTPQHARLRDWLDQAKEEGFVYKAGTDLVFVHDKVREAAYSLIPDSGKREFHHELGMLLLSATAGEEKNMGDIIFQVVDQIRPSLIRGRPVNIARLNFDAASRAMALSDFETALSYLNAASTLLSEDHWSSSYDFSLRLFYSKAKAAYSCGKTKEACDLLKEVIANARSVADKVPSYYLYTTILHASEENDTSYTTCREALSHLDETVPDSIEMKQLGAMIQQTTAKLAQFSDDELINMRDMNGPARSILKFYTLLGCIGFFLKPEMLPFFGCRMIELTLEHGVCQDSVFALVQFAGVLCDHMSKKAQDIKLASRVGQMAMAVFQKRFNSSEYVPKVHFCYYGFIAVHTEPLQRCTDNLLKCFEVGMSSGEDISMAFNNAMRHVTTALFCGKHLPTLLKQTDYHIDLAKRLSIRLPIKVLTTHRETFSILIDKGQATSRGDADASDPDSNYSARHNLTIFLNRAVQAFWLGYSQRCNHYVKKALEMRVGGRFVRTTLLFYASINAFRGVPNANGCGSKFIKAKTLYKDALDELEIAAELSPWNYAHKLHLLMAEMFSFEGKNAEAKASYASAITSSTSSGFIHEQALSCELAGLHYRKTGQTEAALCYFQKAKECYGAWGSQLKVDSVDQQINKMAGAK